MVMPLLILYFFYTFFFLEKDGPKAVLLDSILSHGNPWLPAGSSVEPLTLTCYQTRPGK